MKEMKLHKKLIPAKNKPEAESWAAFPHDQRYELNSNGIIRHSKTLKSPFIRRRGNGLSLICLKNGPSYDLAESILEAFLGRPINSYGAIHINGDVSDNRLSNLKWLIFPDDIEEIPNYRGYFISTKGEIFLRIRKDSRYTWKKIKITTNKNKRRVATLFQNKQKTLKYVSHLMLETYIGPRPIGFQACHNDGNSQNDLLENLRWDTAKGNNADKIKHGTHQIGENNPMSKLTKEDVIEINRSSLPTKALSEKFNVSKSTINYIKSSKTWKSTLRD